MGEITSLYRATGRATKALKTNVPTGIVTHFNLNPGDTLEWCITPDGEGLKISIIPHKQQ